jgi:hypothetical protein
MLRALLVFPLLASIAASGCEETNDVVRLQDEALVMAKAYQQRFDELAHRADAIDPQTLSTAEVQRVYQHARSTLGRYRNEVRQAPIQAQTGARNGNPDELRKLIASLRERFEEGVIDATSGLTAVESWLGVAEQRQMTPRAPAEPLATEPATEDPAPEAPGSDAPIE